jgi:hypothetical protein
MWGIGLFTLAYLAALALLAIGTFGLLGQPRDPLSAVFLIPLGLPWVLWADGLPDAFGPWVAILAPLLNIALLIALCRLLTRHRVA